MSQHETVSLQPPTCTGVLGRAWGASAPPVPVWFMRQAGRSLPEYRALRTGVPMLEACRMPDLVAEITMQPVRRHGVDAAILFSDIVVPLAAAGIGVDIVAGTGPVVADPVRRPEQIDALPELHPGDVEPVTAACRLLVAELGTTPLIGFAGGPFTLASYLIEGGPSRGYARTKALMHGDPELWHSMAAALARIANTFLRVQVEAGVRLVQLFDSWAGALSEADYRRFVLPHSTAALAGLPVPRIHFGVGTGHLLAAMAEAGAEVTGVDWRTPLSQATRLVPGRALQGNLDPVLLLADPSVVATEVARVLADGAAAPEHIFNLGHGVLPETDPAALTRVVDLVHEATVG